MVSQRLQLDLNARCAVVRCGLSSLRWLVVLCLAVFAAAADFRFAEAAGCRYGEHGQVDELFGIGGSGSSEQVGFLDSGKWVYEGGVFKFQPRRGAPPCQGPSCRGRNELPFSTGSSSVNHDRNNSSLPAVLASFDTHFSSFETLLPQSDAVPFSGYPHEFEYPP